MINTMPHLSMFETILSGSPQLLPGMLSSVIICRFKALWVSENIEDK